MRSRRGVAVVVLGVVLGVARVGAAADATVAGQVSAPHPTMRNLALEWAIQGDDDADGRVTVRFRETGTSIWRAAMPLRRVPGGQTPEGFSWTNRHAGSILDLRPGTTYQIELALDDPDGGSTTQTLSAATRPIPRAAADGTLKPVTPSSFAATAGGAAAGDILLLGAGTYAGFTFEQDGTAARPIVLRAATPGTAIVDGSIRLDGRSHVFLEGLTVRGTVRIDDTLGIVVRRCRVETTSDGIAGFGGGATDGWIADNEVLGSTVWEDASLGANGDNVGEGILVTGPGTVIEHNHVKGFRDCISTLEGDEGVDQRSIDILNNDLEVGADDAIEADFAMGNCRVMRNRITNSFVGISSQPGLGGPLYLIRNVMYNVVYSPFKLHRGSVGDVALHNTVVKSGDAFGCYAGVTWKQALFRNNLFIGGQGGGTYGGYGNGDGSVLLLADADDTCDFDYDGLGSIGTGTFEGRVGGTSFTSLATLQSGTTEQHAVQVDLAVFAGSVAFLDSGPYPERAIPDLRLAAGGAAVDRGAPLANVNDGFTGAAPDLGAYEAGQTAPVYGPRASDDQQTCGNGDVEGTEECDDGNTRDGDGCSAACQVAAGIGDGGVPPLGDGGIPTGDGGVPTGDGGVPTGDGGGDPGAYSLGTACGCRAAGPGGGAAALVVVVVVATAAALALGRRRRRGRRGMAR